MVKYSQNSLIGKVLKNIKANKLILPGDRVIVAVSGGPDSICILNILFELKNKLECEIFACHFNHRLRGQESYNDEEFVINYCKSKNITCFVERAKSDNDFKNEEEAREARYKFFEKILKMNRGDRLAIAHTADDMAETVLFRLVRGSGINGLRSIPLKREKIIRPLLPILRSEVVNYLKDEKISYQIDKSNLDTEYSRNFIRLKVMPMLNKLNPNLVKTLEGVSEVVSLDYDLIDELTQKSMLLLLLSEKPAEIVLDHKKWLRLHPALKRSVLRFAINQIDSLKDISVKHIIEVCNLLEKGEGKKHKLLPYSLRIELVSGKIKITKDKSKIKNQTSRSSLSDEVARPQSR